MKNAIPFSDGSLEKLTQEGRRAVAAVERVGLKEKEEARISVSGINSDSWGGIVEFRCHK